MVIDNLDIERFAPIETEAEPPLIVDAHAPLLKTITFQALQPIARRNSHILDDLSKIELDQFSYRRSLDIGKPGNALAGKQRLGIAASKTPDHALY